MNNLKWLEGYTDQTTEELIALEVDYRTDSIVLAFEQALEQKAERIGLESLSKEEIIILAVEALEREVNNGGYDQFFTNSSNKYVPIIVDALSHIGCRETANLTQKAIDALEISGPITVEAIEHALETDDGKRSGKLNGYDGRYYSEAWDLSIPLLKFIKNNITTINLQA